MATAPSTPWKRSVWLADGVCGAVRQYLTGDPNQTHYDRLRRAGVITNPIYINTQPDPGHA